MLDIVRMVTNLLLLTSLLFWAPEAFSRVNTKRYKSVYVQGTKPLWASAHQHEVANVSVRIEKNLPHVSNASEALDVWIKEHWEKGGGLPILISNRKNEVRSIDRKNNEISISRMVIPLMMEETLITPSSFASFPSPVVVEYTVSKPGPFLVSNMVPNSHTGIVQFLPFEDGKNGCKMKWDVNFTVNRFSFFYQALTKLTVGVAARTVSEVLSVPRLLTLRSTLRGVDCPTQGMKSFLNFFWTQGGGLPLPPPILFGDVLNNTDGMVRRSLLRVPPLLMESILSTSFTQNSAEIVYQIDNPGWTTFPFLVHTHLGRVRFEKSTEVENALSIMWEIEIRPFSFMTAITEKLVEMVISTITRNLHFHFSETGNNNISLKPQKWNVNVVAGIEKIVEIPKDIWLAGVLEARLSDRRSNLEQTLSFFQPWKWGRSGKGDENDSVTFSWSRGKIKSR